MASLESIRQKGLCRGLSLTACKHDELSAVELKIIQMTGWQTDLNRPCITKVKEKH